MTESEYIDMVMEAVTNRLAEARKVWPQPCILGPAYKMAEEAGEAVKEAGKLAEGRSRFPDQRQLENEVVDMIATGLRVLIEGDQNIGLLPTYCAEDQSPHDGRGPG